MHLGILTPHSSQRYSQSAHRWTKAFVLDRLVSCKVWFSAAVARHPSKRFCAEWKIDKDSPTDTHRHLSHLIGLYPGYAVASYDATLQGGQVVNGTKITYTKAQILDAAKISLIHRGNGTGPDADSGWEKAWRAAAWAQLGDADQFYHLLTVPIPICLCVRLLTNTLSTQSRVILAQIFLVCMTPRREILSSKLTPTWPTPLPLW